MKPLKNQKRIEHRMTAHCETGTLSLILESYGLKVSEEMIFGVGSGLFFIYFKKHPVFRFPFFATRSAPGSIRKKFNKRVGIKFISKRFFRKSQEVN